MIILLIHKRYHSILGRAINYMSPNSLWAPIKSTISSSIPNCSGPSSSNLKYAKNQLLSLPPSDTYVWADRSFHSLIKLMALKCMSYNLNVIPNTFFSAGPIASSFTAETHPLEYGLVWYNTHETTCHIQ